MTGSEDQYVLTPIWQIGLEPFQLVCAIVSTLLLNIGSNNFIIKYPVKEHKFILFKEHLVACQLLCCTEKGPVPKNTRYRIRQVQQLTESQLYQAVYLLPFFQYCIYVNQTLHMTGLQVVYEIHSGSVDIPVRN